VLEYPVVLESIAARARSTAGRTRIAALRPQAAIGAALEAQRVYADLLACHAAGDAPPAAAPPDLGAQLERIRHPGGALRGEELAQIAALLEQARQWTAWHRRARRETPGLDRLAAALDALEPLHRELVRALEPSGAVRDEASPALSKIRRSLRTLRERLSARLEALVRSVGSPESFVTLREGRYVMALPSGSRRAVSGTVVGHSGSGASVFLEPRDAAEGNSELAERALDEAREVDRILRALTERAHEHRDAIERDFETLARLDAAEAVVSWARSTDGTLPELVEERTLRLRGGRHPILAERHARGEFGDPVPLDLELDATRRMLLVTGPNMGGKTVAMKTVGLLALLAMTGLPVPAAAGTTICWFDRVLCDIGDEQSVQSDISTFLSHVRHVTEALALATPRSLVLLDELGSGTDPAEGAALGQAVLEALRERGVLCVATTHHGPLKAFAQETDGVRNASMAFDEATLRPRFRLVIGVPGGSRAIQVAERFGMESAVLARARQLLPKGERDLDRLLIELGELREEMRAERAALSSTQGQLLARETELKAARDRLEAERKDRKQAELAARRDLLRQLENQIDEYRLRLRHEKKASAATLEEARGMARGISDALDAETPVEPDEAFAAGEAPGALRPGDSVYVPTLRATGSVLSAPDADGRVRVRIGGASAVLPATRLRRVTGAETGPGGASEPRRGSSVSRTLAGGPTGGLDDAEVKREIDVRGFEADDAIRAVERFLEDAAMGGLESARIIHGKGKGILREQMKRWLQKNVLVKEFRLGEIGEGGTGVTIVTLA
jgi:DNA mismatch repair protein MutS2